MRFVVGDVVTRSDGGAPMTVEACNAKSVTCCWFGVDRYGRYIGPYRRRFSRTAIVLRKRSAA